MATATRQFIRQKIWEVQAQEETHRRLSVVQSKLRDMHSDAVGRSWKRLRGSCREMWKLLQELYVPEVESIWQEVKKVATRLDGLVDAEQDSIPFEEPLNVKRAWDEMEEGIEVLCETVNTELELLQVSIGTTKRWLLKVDLAESVTPGHKVGHVSRTKTRHTAEQLRELLPRIQQRATDLHDRGNTWPDVWTLLSEQSRETFGEVLGPGQIKGLYNRSKKRRKSRRGS